MPFINAQLAHEDLPRFDAVEFEALHEDYARICLAVAIVIDSLVLVAFNVLFLVVPPFRAFFFEPLGLFVLFGIALLLAFLAWLTYKAAKVIRYALREHDIIVRTGIFWRKETIQPIRRVQHVEVTQGPLDKQFGMANVRLFSAGTGHLTFEIPGLPVDVAGRIKEYILQRRTGVTAEPDSAS